ncbi:hypothetical protein HPB48_004915 [Haemaphysalis longicornis]|uniref:Uncharacterized protein n=1 Tax=Haemaphysalis longicornis TaxID=44386 RepID=A0A9J6GCP9_HAELO|nr:hypothetical protein HPB48_004915 [Haemaphysalis longicornis]
MSTVAVRVPTAVQQDSCLKADFHVELIRETAECFAIDTVTCTEARSHSPDAGRSPRAADFPSYLPVQATPDMVYQSEDSGGSRMRTDCD